MDKQHDITRFSLNAHDTKIYHTIYKDMVQNVGNTQYLILNI